MIDLHCHLLPSIDDGSLDTASALEQARIHLAAGVDEVVCTPHVSHGYGNTATGIAAATATFERDLAEAGIDLQIRAGAEVSLARAIELPDDELRALHLGTSDWLLLEPPLGSDVPRLRELVHSVRSRGHGILLAHPERCAAFHHDAGLLAELVEDGALVQLTAGSFSGQFGRTVQKLATTMAKEGLIHVVSSDAHDTSRRPPGLAGALEAAGLSELVAWACHDVPRAMLAGDDLPERPVGTVRRRRLFGR